MIVRSVRWTLLLLLGSLLAACGAAASAGPSGATTIYDLTQQPGAFANRQVRVLGTYLWKPGNPSTSVLLPGLHTSDGVNDAQPIYASVACQPNGECTPDTTAVGEPATGAVWLDNFPAEVTADLHRPRDSVWGVVEVAGTFETGSFGPDGAYHYRIVVTDARALQKVEREITALENKPLDNGKVSLFALADQPAAFAGKQVTTQGYYFWSPATSGLLVEKVSREKSSDATVGLDPQPEGRIIALDGFPPELSGQLNVGPGNSYVWGLVEVTGTFETGGKWGPNGEYSQHFVIDNGKATVLGK